jgi:hypothetical protein
VPTKIEEALEGLQLSDEAAGAVKAIFESQHSELESKDERLRKLEEDAHTRRVDDRIKQIQGWGFEDSGFLRTVRDVLMADNGGNAIMFADESGEDVPATVSDAVNRVIDALPKTEEVKEKMRGQHDNQLGFADRDRPKFDSTDTRTIQERTAAAEADLAGEEIEDTAGGEK